LREKQDYVQYFIKRLDAQFVLLVKRRLLALYVVHCNEGLVKLYIEPSVSFDMPLQISSPFNYKLGDLSIKSLRT